MAKPLRENRIPIMLTEEEVRAIDDWRYDRRVATRSGAIRRMVQNALHLEDDLEEIMDDAEVVYDNVHLALQRLLDTRLQHLGRHNELPAREWTVDELIDRESDRASELFDQAHSLYLLLLKLNNRVAVMTTNATLRAGRAAARREIETIERERTEYLEKQAEGSENRRLMHAFSWLTDRDFFGDRDKWSELSDEEQDQRLEVAMDHLQFIAERAQVAVDDQDIKRRKSVEPADKDLAAVISYQVARNPERPVEWHLDRVIRDYFKDANPVVAAHMIRAAIDAHAENGGSYVGSKA